MLRNFSRTRANTFPRDFFLAMFVLNSGGIVRLRYEGQEKAKWAGDEPKPRVFTSLVASMQADDVFAGYPEALQSAKQVYSCPRLRNKLLQ